MLLLLKVAILTRFFSALYKRIHVAHYYGEQLPAAYGYGSDVIIEVAMSAKAGESGYRLRTVQRSRQFQTKSPGNSSSCKQRRGVPVCGEDRLIPRKNMIKPAVVVGDDPRNSQYILRQSFRRVFLTRYLYP